MFGFRESKQEWALTSHWTARIISRQDRNTEPVRNSFLFMNGSKGALPVTEGQPSTMPHIYIATRITCLYGSSGDSNQRTHASKPGIVTTRSRWTHGGLGDIRQSKCNKEMALTPGSISSLTADFHIYYYTFAVFLPCGWTQYAFRYKTACCNK